MLCECTKIVQISKESCDRCCLDKNLMALLHCILDYTYVIKKYVNQFSIKEIINQMEYKCVRINIKYFGSAQTLFFFQILEVTTMNLHTLGNLFLIIVLVIDSSVSFTRRHDFLRHRRPHTGNL